MIPILYEEDELDFTSNGIGRLNDCLKCTATEARNGVFEVAFVYPVNGQYYDEIRERRIIYCTYDDTQEPQPFDIYGHSAPLNGKVTFYAQHISYRLGKQTVMPFTAGSATQAMSRLGSNIVGGTTFTFWTDKSTAANYNQTVPKSVRACLGGSEGSMLDVFGGGEYKFDKWAVRLYQNRGTNTGVQIRYGKNLTRLTHDVDGSETYSAVVPFWKPFEEGQSAVWYPGIVYADTVQTRLTVWTDENGADVEDENGDAIDIRYSIAQVIPLDLSDEFDEQPTEDQLRLKAQSYLSGKNTALPKETLDIDFVALWQTTEYADVASLQRVKLCDYVSVYYPEMGVAVENVEVIKTVYNVLLDRYDRMELGQPKQSFAGIVKGQTAAMLETVPTKSSMAQAIDYATKLIQGGLGGHVVMSMDEASGKPNEILIMDTEDTATAVNVLRINMNGIGFSRNGYNGPFETAWTIDGHFNASWIDTGVLTANLIKTGVLQDMSGKFYLNLKTGEIVMNDGSFSGEVEVTSKMTVLTQDGNKDLEMNGDGMDIYATIGTDTVWIGKVGFVPVGTSRAVAVKYDATNAKSFRVIRVNADNTETMVFRIHDAMELITTPYGIYADGDVSGASFTATGNISGAQLAGTSIKMNGNSGVSGTMTVDGHTYTFTNGILTGIS